MAIDETGDDSSPEDKWISLEPIERDMLAFLAKRGTSVTNLSNRLGIPYHRAYYHVVRLMIMGLLRRSKLGHEKKCLISDEGRELVEEWGSDSARVLREDSVFRIRNRQICFSVVPECGGRIAEIVPQGSPGTDGDNLLHTLYPEYRSFGRYTEYGGMEEQIFCGADSFPGLGWKQSWHAGIVSENSPASLAIETQVRGSGTLDLRRVFTLDSCEPLIKIERSFRSLTERFLTFRWSNHPELRRDIFDSYSVPGERGIQTGRLSLPGRQDRLPCQGDWWLAYSSDTGVFLGEVFPKGVLDEVCVYDPKVGDHYVVLASVMGRLVQQQTATFESFIVTGTRGPDAFLDQVERLDPVHCSEAEWEEPEEA